MPATMGAAPIRAVVSANFARLAFPDLPLDGAIGQRIASRRPRARDIIGVVGDVDGRRLRGANARRVHAHRQFAGNRNWALTQASRATVSPERSSRAVRAVVARLDPELVVYRAESMADIVGRGPSVANDSRSSLMGAFAGVALLLAAIGLYGVLAYSVRQRTQEIGIRMALGATARQVAVAGLPSGAAVVGVGLVVGVAGALVLGRWLSSLTFQVSPSDARILVAHGAAADVDGARRRLAARRGARRVLSQRRRCTATEAPGALDITHTS